MINDIELLPPKHRNLAVKVAPKSPKLPSRIKLKWRAKIVVQRVKFEEPQQNDDSEGHSDCKDPTNASSEDNIEV
jgi:hypothetical protein